MSEDFQSRLQQCLRAALTELRTRAVDPYTFAVYFDHEGAMLSICVDSELNSRRQVQSQREYSRKHFERVLRSGDAGELALWQTNIGRNLSLGDFELVNLARCDAGVPEIKSEHVLEVVHAVEAVRGEVLSLTSAPSDLVFCCSTEEDEVGLVWS